MKKIICLSKDKLEMMLNEEEVAVYTALKIMFDRMRTDDKEEIKVFVNAQSIYYELSGKFELTRTDKTKLENGIKSLVGADIIDLIDTDNKGNFVLNIANLYIDSANGESYTQVGTDEIINIINIPYKQKYNLLRLALSAYGFIYNDSKCSFASIAKLQETAKIKSNNTVLDMMKVLEENNIFYVCHSDTAKRDKNGQIKQLSNVYGRPENKAEIDLYFEERLYKQGHDFTKTMTSTRKAQITRDYNKYCKGKFEDDVIKLIQEVLAYNEVPYAEPKDLSVFDKKDIDKAQEGLKEIVKEIKKEVKEQEEKELVVKHEHQESSCYESNKYYTPYNYYDDFDDDEESPF